MNNKIFDSGLFGLALFAIILPSALSRGLIALFFIFFVVRGIVYRNLWGKIEFKLFILILLLPGIFLSILSTPDSLVRFLPIILFLFGLPYNNFSLNPFFIFVVVFMCFCYLFVTQAYLALGHHSFIEFRDAWYPIEYNHWKYRQVDSLFFDRSMARAPGVFYNPNNLGLVQVFLMFVFSLSYCHLEVHKKTHATFLSLCVDVFYYAVVIAFLFSIFLTGSRTAMIGAASFLAFRALKAQRLLNGRINLKSSLTLGLIVLFSSHFLVDIMIDAFDPNRGSASAKFSILIDYLRGVSSFELFFGGNFDVHFDAEYGYWIGSGGLFALSAMILVMAFLFLRFKGSRAIILSIVLMSYGSSIFYGLLTGALAVIVLAISIIFERQAQSPQFSRRLVGFNH